MEPELRSMQGMVNRTKDDTDTVLLFDYIDRDGNPTSRVTSPIRMHEDGERFLAMCFSREQSRWFRFSQCDNMRIDQSHKYQMPMLPYVKVEVPEC